jgi:transposase-like protein
MDLKKARLAWVELDAKTRDAVLVCRRCGISRSTLRKWWRCRQADGEAGRAEDSGVGAPGRDLKIVEQILSGSCVRACD